MKKSKASRPVTASTAVPGSCGWRLPSGDGRAIHQSTPSAAWQPFQTDAKISHLAQKVKAHGFASPSFDGFALSRMKGVAIQARQKRLAPKSSPKLTASFAYRNLRHNRPRCNRKPTDSRTWALKRSILS